MSMETEQKFLTTEQAAEFLNMAKGTLQNWRKKGLGPRFVRMGSRAIRYEKSDLEEFVERRQSKVENELPAFKCF